MEGIKTALLTNRFVCCCSGVRRFADGPLIDNRTTSAIGLTTCCGTRRSRSAIRSWRRRFSDQQAHLCVDDYGLTLKAPAGRTGAGGRAAGSFGPRRQAG